MIYCDICGAPKQGTWISAEDMRKAVFKNGFNPFASGVNRELVAAFGGPYEITYEAWKNTVVAQDTSDWNICHECMSRLRPYLEGPPRPMGTKEAVVSADPKVSAFAGAVAVERYKSSNDHVFTPPFGQQTKKKWWQFWK